MMNNEAEVAKMRPENKEKIVVLRHRLHQNPELSLQEKETIAILKAFLKENTSLKIVDKDGWFYAVKQGTDEKAPIAFRADMDALPIEEGLDLPYASQNPGVSHKCGHDGHCAALCGLGLELDQIAADRTVYLLFQPAEEIGEGAKRCAALLSEKQISETYAFHNYSGYPEGAIVYRRGLTQPASEGLTLRFVGKQSHASAPEEGRNPASSIAETALYAQSLTQECHKGMVLCTIVGMTVGSGDFGISPGEGTLQMTLRAEREAEMKEMETSILEYASWQAAVDGLTLHSEIRDDFPETRNHDQALEKVLRCGEKLGFSVREMEELWRASEDFGQYLKVCPGAMIYIGNGETYPALHTREYDFNDKILPTAVDLFLALATCSE